MKYRVWLLVVSSVTEEKLVRIIRIIHKKINIYIFISPIY